MIPTAITGPPWKEKRMIRSGLKRGPEQFEKSILVYPTDAGPMTVAGMAAALNRGKQQIRNMIADMGDEYPAYFLEDGQPGRKKKLPPDIKKPTRMTQHPIYSKSRNGGRLTIYVTDVGLFNIRDLSAIVEIPKNTLYDRIVTNWDDPDLFNPKHKGFLRKKEPLNLGKGKLSGLSGRVRCENLIKIAKGGTWEMDNAK